MKPYNVYPLFDITPVRAEGCYLWDEKDVKYLDMYGGHAVISIGHSHPHYLKRINKQLAEIAFYSNSLKIPLQNELAEKLGRISGYPDYDLFLCNSGAEANENALKLASFYNGRKQVVAFRKGFHGRTSAAVSITDNPAIRSPLNENSDVVFLDLNDYHAIEDVLNKRENCAVIIEGIQGIGGIFLPEIAFLHRLASLCRTTGTVLILDEIQSGYGRSGQFFAHQHAVIQPDLITIAKGMGNGFPVGGVLIHPKIEAVTGRLGTTFGGNHLACAASLAVLEVLENEALIARAAKLGEALIAALKELPVKDVKVRGKGLMIGIEFPRPCKPIRQRLIAEHQVLTGAASDPNTLRILPPLTIGENEIEQFLKALKKVLEDE